MASAEALLEVLSTEEEGTEDTDERGGKLEKLEKRLERLGIQAAPGDPQECYQTATKLFRRAQSFYESQPGFPVVTKD